MIKRKAKKTARVKKARRAKKSAKAAPKRHNPKPYGRAVGALERLEKLTEKYIAEGLSPTDARARAMAEMRANPRRDWRAG
jgi:hypothetical protein